LWFLSYALYVAADDFKERLDRAIEAYRDLVTSSNSATQMWFEVDHRSEGTCEACAGTHMKSAVDINGLDIVICKSCGHERHHGTPPKLPPSPWTKFEV